MDGNAELALITGASSGIGAEIARQLARRKVDLVITARRVDRLEQLRAELCAQYGIEVTVIQEDLNHPDAADRLFAKVGRLDRPVSILVNNAGFGRYCPLVKLELEDIAAQIQVDLATPTRLMRLFAAEMKERGHGYILNVGSVAGLQPLPRYSIYAASKAYMVSLSLSVRHELRKTGVSVTALCPGFVRTEFFDTAQHKASFWMRIMLLEAPGVARAGVRGMYRKRGLVIPGLLYKFNALLARVLPRQTAAALAAGVLKSH